MRTLIVLSIAALLMLPRPVRAQGARALLDGRVFWNMDESWPRRVAASAGGGASIALEVWRRVGVEVAGDWPVPVANTRVLEGVDRLGGRQQERITIRERFAAPSGTAAVRIRLWSAPRVGVTAITGLAFVSQVSGFTVERANGTLESGNASTHWRAGSLGGIEASIQVSAHVAVVPQIRAVWVWFPLSYDGTMIVRPAVGVRWMF
jgi:hypothetical protein